MLPILIAYGTTEGHTRKVAEFMAERLRIRGHRVDLVDTAGSAAEQVQPFYQGAIVGGSLHMGRHQSSLRHFLKVNRPWLNSLPLGFFSVSLSAALDDADSRNEIELAADEFMHDCDLQPISRCCIAGALKYTQYDYFKRTIMRLIAQRNGRSTDVSNDYEYTDWTQVEVFVDDFLHRAGIGQGRHGEGSKQAAPAR